MIPGATLGYIVPGLGLDCVCDRKHGLPPLSSVHMELSESRAFRNSSGVYICKSVENDLKHGNFIYKSVENDLKHGNFVKL